MDDNDVITTPFLNSFFVSGAVGYKGRQVLRSKSGYWRSAYFIISVEVAERFAYYGVSSNLITYLTGSLGLSTATAAENVNAWTGTASLLPLVGAFIADACTETPPRCRMTFPKRGETGKRRGNVPKKRGNVFKIVVRVYL
ncbi:proton-dependent oligopeptide transporter family protein [Tanacetum coccineum]